MFDVALQERVGMFHLQRPLRQLRISIWEEEVSIPLQVFDCPYLHFIPQFQLCYYLFGMEIVLGKTNRLK